MSEQNELKIKNVVMDKILSGQVKMKPKWYFVAGSALSFIGLVGLIIGSTFLVNLMMFLIRKQGPGTGRILYMLENFPLWVPFVAFGFVILGIILLKRYDFSYKKNFTLIVLTMVLAVLVSAKLIDLFGFSKIWEKKGPWFMQHNCRFNHPACRYRNL